MLNISFYSTPEFKAALRLVWIVITLATASAAAVPFVVPEPTIARLVPPCESKRLYGKECVLCGTTTGFIDIAHGDWSAARLANPLAIPLFVAFSLNAVLATAYFTTWGRRRR